MDSAKARPLPDRPVRRGHHLVVCVVGGVLGCLLLSLLTVLPAAVRTAHAAPPPAMAAASPPADAITAPEADDPAAAIEERYQQLGGPAGVLGAPTSAVTPILLGFVRTYAHGRIYYSTPTGAHELLAGPILDRYLALGGPTGKLGLPTSGEAAVPPTGARASVFQHGRIYWSASTRAWEVTGVILTYYLSLGASASALGLPTSAEYISGRGALVQNFFHSRVYWSQATGARSVYGQTLVRYLALGGSAGSLGLPTVSEHAAARPGARVTEFQSGRIWYSPATGAWEVRGATLAKYLKIGADAFWIGLPVSVMRQTSYGYRQDFQNASIQYLDARKAAYVRVPFTTSVVTPKAKDIPYTYRSGCPVAPSGLRIITVPFRNFYGDDGYGRIVVRASVVPEVTVVFKYAHANWWPLRHIYPVDKYKGSDPASMQADNTSAFNCRKVTGNPYRLSQHSYGNAIDINPFENPYVTATRVYPDGSEPFLNRSNVRPGMILRGDPVELTMRRLGWPWGARWADPDYQHFSENGA
ncbi:M15 family metallopeptidase [Actinopolymorpha pittospori]